jgi:hypothetical protein
MAIKKNFNTADICPRKGGSGECHSTPSKNIKAFLPTNIWANFMC